jgi:hypothetical protein
MKRNRRKSLTPWRMMSGDDRGKFKRKSLIIIRNPLLYPAELRALLLCRSH